MTLINSKKPFLAVKQEKAFFLCSYIRLFYLVIAVYSPGVMPYSFLNVEIKWL